MDDLRARQTGGNGSREETPAEPVFAERAIKPIRKDERIVTSRGLYIESWLPERRSRRKPIYMLHGELGGSWLWHRYLGYFAPRGWEGHALNLRGHYWSETADFGELDFDSYAADAIAGGELMPRPPIVFGHGMGGLLALKVAEAQPVSALVLLSPALPAALLLPPPAHMVRLLPRRYRRELVGWDGSAELIRHQNPDLTHADVLRIQHLMGPESGSARRQMLEGVPVEKERLPEVPMLVIGAGLDRFFAESDSERLAEWLAADYLPYGAHSHYGLVAGEESHTQVAEAIRSFIESHRL
ncbi:MAG TPA: alpha/beta fold hydrolase [Candidatus Limnocylindria bacterium]|nr:alpha/beta fold hydrolase [Candidatus Limnocylindria bacterium]